MHVVLTRAMADNSFEWARQRGRLRKNPVHGGEEADIPLEQLWSITKEMGQRTEFSGTATMEEPWKAKHGDTSLVKQ